MMKINDSVKLEYYINKFSINDIFTNDMKDYMELFLFSKNEHICKDKEKLNYLYFLVDGKAKVYILQKNGKSLLIQFINPLEVIGDIEVIDISFANSNIQAIKDTLCIGVAMDNIRKVFLNDTKFLRFVCKSLGQKLNDCSKASSINLLYPLENRLAGYLLAITPPNGELSALDEITTHKLTEIADLLGTSYRHLVRVLNKLCTNKIIKKEKVAIIILNRPLLEELAGDLYE